MSVLLSTIEFVFIINNLIAYVASGAPFAKADSNAFCGFIPHIRADLMSGVASRLFEGGRPYMCRVPVGVLACREDQALQVVGFGDT